jgi:hypothetical protein
MLPEESRNTSDDESPTPQSFHSRVIKNVTNQLIISTNKKQGHCRKPVYGHLNLRNQSFA